MVNINQNKIVDGCIDFNEHYYCVLELLFGRVNYHSQRLVFRDVGIQPVEKSGDFISDIDQRH